MADFGGVSGWGREFRANPRLRCGLWVVLAILWGYGVLLVQESAQAAAQAHAELGKKLARAQAQAAETIWQSRLKEIKALELAQEKRLWRANTQGLARANFQDWLHGEARRSGVARPQITVAATESGPSEKTSTPEHAGYWKVSARLAFDFNPKTAYPLLAALSSNQQRVSIESISIKGAPVLRAEMVVTAWFRQQATLSMSGK